MTGILPDEEVEELLEKIKHFTNDGLVDKAVAEAAQGELLLSMVRYAQRRYLGTSSSVLQQSSNSVVTPKNPLNFVVPRPPILENSSYSSSVSGSVIAASHHKLSN